MAGRASHGNAAPDRRAPQTCARLAALPHDAGLVDAGVGGILEGAPGGRRRPADSGEGLVAYARSIRSAIAGPTLAAAAFATGQIFTVEHTCCRRSARHECDQRQGAQKRSGQ